MCEMRVHVHLVKQKVRKLSISYSVFLLTACSPFLQRVLMATSD